MIDHHHDRPSSKVSLLNNSNSKNSLIAFPYWMGMCLRKPSGIVSDRYWSERGDIYDSFGCRLLLFALKIMTSSHFNLGYLKTAVGVEAADKSDNLCM